MDKKWWIALIIAAIIILTIALNLYKTDTSPKLEETTQDEPEESTEIKTIPTPRIIEKTPSENKQQKPQDENAIDANEIIAYFRHILRKYIFIPQEQKNK